MLSVFVAGFYTKICMKISKISGERLHDHWSSVFFLFFFFFFFFQGNLLISLLRQTEQCDQCRLQQNHSLSYLNIKCYHKYILKSTTLDKT